MIIHQFKTSSNNEHIQRSALIEWEYVTRETHPWYKPPERLTYTVPKRFSHALSDNLNSFLIPMVSVAMFFNEPIHVKGEISETLLYNLAEYQRALHFWRPNWFTIIKISADSYCADTAAPASNRGSIASYSGGVDSSYTLWSHLPKQESLPSKQLTHLVYIRDFDTPDDIETQMAKIKTYRPFVESLNLEFIDVSSNAMKFQVLDEWRKVYFMFSSVLVGAMVQFEPVASDYYFSADNTHDFPIISTINHQIVPLLSTDAMNMSVHGATVSKLQKLRALSTWTAIYDKLVVCYVNPDGVKNCGKCVKCYLTMTALDMLGNLHLFSTLPNKVPRLRVLGTRHRPPFVYFPKTWIRFARKTKRYDYVAIYSWVYIMSVIKAYTSHLTMYIPKMKHIYIVSAFFKKYLPGYNAMITIIKK